MASNSSGSNPVVCSMTRSSLPPAGSRIFRNPLHLEMVSERSA
jgi:hypothetical protein